MKFYNIVTIGDYVYMSVLYKSYYAVDFIQKINNDIVRVGCPYRTDKRALNALQQLKKEESLPMPDYKIEYIKGGMLCR